MRKEKQYLGGKTFGKLTVLREGLPDQHGRRQWYCMCACGGAAIIAGSLLNSGDRKNCGCVRAARVSKSPEYQSWNKMMHRCFDPKCKDYERYHSKGITVCSFIKGGAHALVEAIGKRDVEAGMTLDRIDNGGNYSCGSCPECAANNWPKNIRWADKTQQSRNQDRIRFVEIDGVSACIGEWAERTGIHYQTLMTRYKRGIRGPALIAPSGPTGKRYS